MEWNIPWAAHFCLFWVFSGTKSHKETVGLVLTISAHWSSSPLVSQSLRLHQHPCQRQCHLPCQSLQQRQCPHQCLRLWHFFIRVFCVAVLESESEFMFMSGSTGDPQSKSSSMPRSGFTGDPQPKSSPMPKSGSMGDLQPEFPSEFPVLALRTKDLRGTLVQTKPLPCDSLKRHHFCLIF